ncbi:MAG: ribonuclease P protein component [Phycisphaerales bacterium]|nr:ribonuclease P protein component [Phycisphaerales bacterium]
MAMQKISYPPEVRLTRKKEFSSMFSEGIRKKTGPLLVYRKSNTFGHARLGLSVPKGVGNAVVRNTIKRKCREAFRSLKAELPAIDILLTVRPHETMHMEAYKKLIRKGVSV